MSDYRQKIERFLPFFCLALFLASVTLGAFTGGMWATTGIGGACVMWICVGAHDRRLSLPPRALTLLVAVVIAIFAAEIPLSSAPVVSGHFFLRLASIFVPLLVLTMPRVQTLARHSGFTPIVAAAAGLAAVMLSCELRSGGVLLHLIRGPAASLTEYNRGMAHLVILSFALFAGLWSVGRRKAALALAVLLLFPASLTESHTAKLALITGSVGTAVALWRPAVARYALGAFLIALTGWPFAAQAAFTHAYGWVEKLHPSWRHRVEIWDYLSYRIAERPLLGWGLGTTRALDVQQPHGALYQYALSGAPHAHNFIVQLWVETGLPGLALGVTFAFMALNAAYRLHASLRPFAMGCWMAAVTVSLFGFDFWTDALWSAFALAAFAFGLLQQQIKRGDNLVDA